MGPDDSFLNNKHSGKFLGLSVIVGARREKGAFRTPLR